MFFSHDVEILSFADEWYHRQFLPHCLPDSLISGPLLLSAFEYLLFHFELVDFACRSGPFALFVNV
jgi:hypothetical protein